MVGVLHDCSQRAGECCLSKVSSRVGAAAAVGTDSINAGTRARSSSVMCFQSPDESYSGKHYCSDLEMSVCS